MTVLFLEQLGGVGAQLVIGQAENKADDEEGRIVVEDAVVEGCINATLREFVVTDGRMSVEAIHLVMGLTSKQTNLYRIHRWQVVILCQRCILTEQSQQEKSPSEDAFYGL